jgi:hypothetical protein
MRGQGAVVEQQIYRGPRCEGRELIEELDGLEEQMRRAIVVVVVVICRLPRRA